MKEKEKYKIIPHSIIQNKAHKITGSIFYGECVICMLKDGVTAKASNQFPFSPFRTNFFFCNKHTEKVKTINDKEGVLEGWYDKHIRQVEKNNFLNKDLP